jgi:diaminohydroxyphosphoribosylaminopyrimidine deaminase/5-amino-6-(5-phosphoribosylamino)uracil reductase
VDAKMNDILIMRRVLELAKKGTGLVPPNPLVGTVIIQNDQIISEGYHEKYGEKHAEIAAIEKTTQSLEGATLYCNLEPCISRIPNKKTPSCTERIIREKIKRVVISTKDPNPYVNGRGIKLLKKNNIEVIENILADEAEVLNERYFKFTKSRHPFIHLKIAQSIDGRIATLNGHSKWITNQTALTKVHELRSQYDAILVGSNTVIKDDPSLTVRLTNGKNPYRIILDNNLETSINSKLFSEMYKQKTLVFTSLPESDNKFKKFRNNGIQVIRIAIEDDKNLDLHEIIKYLGKMNITSILVEGGSKIFTSFIKKRLFDKMSIFIAPILIGKGIESIGDLGIKSLKEAYRLERVKFEIIDQQVLIEGYRHI